MKLAMSSLTKGRFKWLACATGGILRGGTATIALSTLLAGVGNKEKVSLESTKPKTREKLLRYVPDGQAKDRRMRSQKASNDDDPLELPVNTFAGSTTRLRHRTPIVFLLHQSDSQRRCPPLDSIESPACRAINCY
jgi:hypothetical protein